MTIAPSRAARSGARAAATARTARTDGSAAAAARDAERRLYEAELALHAARQSGVDPWIAAAYDKLHAAVCAHTAAHTAARCA